MASLWSYKRHEISIQTSLASTSALNRTVTQVLDSGYTMFRWWITAEVTLWNSGQTPGSIAPPQLDWRVSFANGTGKAVLRHLVLKCEPHTTSWVDDSFVPPLTKFESIWIYHVSDSDETHRATFPPGPTGAITCQVFMEHNNVGNATALSAGWIWGWVGVLEGKRTP